MIIIDWHVCLPHSTTVDFEGGSLRHHGFLRFLHLLHCHARNRSETPGPRTSLCLPQHQVLTHDSLPWRSTQASIPPQTKWRPQLRLQQSLQLHPRMIVSHQYLSISINNPNRVSQSPSSISHQYPQHTFIKLTLNQLRRFISAFAFSSVFSPAAQAVFNNLIICWSISEETFEKACLRSISEDSGEIPKFFRADPRDETITYE